MFSEFDMIMITLMSVFILIFIIAIGIRTIIDAIYIKRDNRYRQIKEHLKNIEEYLIKQGFELKI